MPIHVIYSSFGGRKYHDQTRFSVLTLLHLLLEAKRTDIRIVVYTDAPATVPKHDLVISMPFTAQQLAEFRGPLEYVHRVKVAMLQHAAKHFGTALLYIDGDTRWRELPNDVFEQLALGNNIYMHVDEGRLSEQFFPSYFHALENLRAPLQSFGMQFGTPDLTMWNAGVIGVPAGSDAFLARVLAVNDFLFPRLTPRNWVEQLAWALAVAERDDVVALGDKLHHYWNYSYEAPIYLAEIFSGIDENWSVERQAEYCAKYDWSEARLKELVAAPEHKRQRRLKKWRASIQKRKMGLRIRFSQLLGRGTF
ncbi:hypothetical protein WKR88_27870 [Trinickia caryophylli]|uniref:Glycosyl transferase family 8 n=1 Tax=Trinickia caryophylli TaxID=28094 RepID=A0A1X7GZ38_TRICW|nr:hypothetical protein [Trinickia caryophylli]PMS10089.1 hypothetical protein C0Z17_21190 [Trinickia caryophylli]TRX18185.1 hypothetical protein FNF07_08120 [Trinickia caryophylli]WQE11026.1 hypothetical protein U0034_14795 [Trinickia caryophylli]SMF77029.1 hypothetical protein SAMN06295900_119101 [Trinickia caryophylli]GLU35355.1 hypothetical protein Busp01_51970 [Trinickia caryophylli]